MARTRSRHQAKVDPGKQAFSIYRDWNGMYRWTLTDQNGHRLLASQFGSAALAGALREVNTVRSRDHHYAGAQIRDETGR